MTLHCCHNNLPCVYRKKSDAEKIKELERQHQRGNAGYHDQKKDWFQTIKEQLASYPTVGIEPLRRVFGKTHSASYKAEDKTSYHNLEHALIIGHVREVRVDQPCIRIEKI